MSLPNSIAAYTDCFDILTRAVDDPKGVRVRFADEGKAKFFQLRANQARTLQREESMRIYDRGDVRWGKSEYDALVVRNPIEDTEGAWWVYVERHSAQITEVESLSEIEDET